MRPGSYGTQSFQLPPLLPWVRNLLLGLFGLYVLEIIARSYSGLSVDQLAWAPLGHGFRVWQLATHYLVQGASSQAAMRLVFGLLILYFFLPAITQVLSRQVLVRGMAAGAVGGLVLGLGGDGLLHLLGGSGAASAMGWWVLTGSAVMIFGLAMPNADIRLFFVIPIKGVYFVWGSVILSLIYVALGPSVSTFELLGATLGPLAWWHWLGPAARRRHLKAKARSIEKELARFTVIEGGKSDDDDEWIH